ncbi:MAG: sugar phosphate isomerase/epimerase, partial [Abditibacteriales bacterium]|nr:sugar phosphate isomerase/epimerase [Abditibacteriales bacterium]MDW8367382.1 sugar phosphate isomerase/epimerase family protein [Abditibacteriales bacterium]
EHLHAVGYDAIEIVCGPKNAHIITAEPLPPQIEATRELLQKFPLQVAAINPYSAPALANRAKEDPASAEAFWGQLLEIAVALEAPTVNFLPGWLPDGDAATWKVLVDILKKLTRRAEALGVNLAIHNHEGHVIDAPDKCLVLIEHVGSPRLKVLCDITNFHILGSNVRWAVQRLAPHIVHCHEKGVRGKYPFAQFLVPGEDGDELDFDAFAAALGEIGYDRFISVETFSHMREDKARIAYEMMSQRLKALGLRAGS